MDELPPEILHRIFIHLPIIQKQECMLVCHDWEQIISTRCLFRNIDCPSIRLRDDFINLVQKSPSIGLQVENITLCGHFNKQGYMTPPSTNAPSPYPNASLQQILQLFPNLRSIELNCDKFQGPLQTTRSIEAFKITPFPCKIESICENNSVNMTCALATSGLCSSIVSLILKIPFSENLRADEFCPLLTNMPVLENLEIKIQNFTPQNCEVIHSNIPSLNYLKISLEYSTDNVGYPGNIEPSTSITKLYLDMYITERVQINNWFYYINKKYPNLRDFHFGNSGYRSFYLQKPLQLAWSPMVTSLGIPNCYDDSLSTLFHILDKSGCRINNLKLLVVTKSIIDALIGSEQCRYITTLCIRLDDRYSLKGLKKMEKLKTLSLSSTSDKNYKASHLFNSCPKALESVDIKEYFVEFDLEAITQTFPIKKLALSHIRNDPRISCFIVNYFPHLESLSIQQRFNRDTSYHFPDHHFSYLEVCRSETFNLTIRTLSDSVTRFYSLTYQLGRPGLPGQQKYENYIGAVPREKMTGSTVTAIVCGSVKNLSTGSLNLSLIPKN